MQYDDVAALFDSYGRARVKRTLQDLIDADSDAYTQAGDKAFSVLIASLEATAQQINPELDIQLAVIASFDPFGRPAQDRQVERLQGHEAEHDRKAQEPDRRRDPDHPA